MGPPDPKDVAAEVSRELAQLASDLNRAKTYAAHWLEGLRREHRGPGGVRYPEDEREGP